MGPISLQVTESVVEVVGNLLETDSSSFSEDTANSTSSVIRSLEHQVEITLASEGALRIVDLSVAVDALTITPGDSIVGGLTFVTIDDGNDARNDLNEERVQTYTNVGQVPDNVETTIQLPESLFPAAHQMTGK